MCASSQFRGLYGPRSCHPTAELGRSRRERPRGERAQDMPSEDGGIGRRARFRFWCPKGRGGSSPLLRTKQSAAGTGGCLAALDIAETAPRLWPPLARAALSAAILRVRCECAASAWGGVGWLGAEQQTRSWKLMASRSTSGVSLMRRRCTFSAEPICRRWCASRGASTRHRIDAGAAAASPAGAGSSPR
jgi:hypothetical protein